MAGYRSTGISEYSEEIRKSRFLVYAGPAEDEVSAMNFIREHSDRSASHNCWAFRAGGVCRFSDDGEPGGTAGRPVLSAIENKGFDHTAVLVIRYFGGIKLGAGGLVRAYSGTASRCLDRMPAEEIREYVILSVSFSFEYTGKVYGIIKNSHVMVLNEVHGPHGTAVTLKAEKTAAESLCPEIAGATGGAASVSEIHPEK